MLFDAIRLVQGAEVNVSAVTVGDEFPPGIPAIGELFYADGTGTPTEGLYVYTSGGWTINTDAYVAVNKAGDTMTGNLILNADPTLALGAATKQYVDNLPLVITEPLVTLASTVTEAGFRMPHGTAPTSPVNGDVWTTTSGLYARINGSTLGPIGSGVGAAAGSDSHIQFNDGGSLGADADFTWNKTTNTLTIGATGARIRANFDAATFGDRACFQTTTTNGYTSVFAIPNGTGSDGGFYGANSSTATNCGYFGVAIGNTEANFTASRTGTGTSLPMRFRVGDSATVATTIHANGNTNFGPSTTDPQIEFNVEGKARIQGSLVISDDDLLQPSPLDANYFSVGVGKAAAGLIGSGATTARLWLVSNLYYNGAAWKYGENGAAGNIALYDNDFYFQSAPTGTGGVAATLTTRLRWNSANTRFEVTGGLITNPSADGLEPINIVAGGSSGGSAAGDATLQAGASTGSGIGGTANLIAGASTGGIGGHVNIASGASSAASTASGNITNTIPAPGAGGTAGQFRWISDTSRIATLHAQTGNFNIGGSSTDPGAKLAVQGLLLTDASDISEAGLRVPHGTAPTAPVNGDVWTTTAGMYVRVNGSTVGPLSGGSGVPGGSDTHVQYNDAGAFGGDANFVWAKATKTLTFNDGKIRLNTGGGLELSAAGSANMLYSHAASSFAIGAGNSSHTATSGTVTVKAGNTTGVGATGGKLSLEAGWGVGATMYGGDVDVVAGSSWGAAGTYYGKIAMFNGANRALTIFGNGNVNVGTSATDPTVKLRVEGATTITGGVLTAAATVAGYASLNLPHGTAPTSPTNGDVWTTASGMYVHVNGSTVGPLAVAGAAIPGGSDTHVQFNDGGSLGGDADFTWNKTTNTLTITGGPTVLAATATGYASLNLPHGTAPSTPTNGDVWTTTGGMYARINGATVGPFAPNVPAGSDTQLQFNNGGAFGGDSDLTWNTATSGLTITGSTGARILGDLTNSTDANRLMFQTTAATSPTHLGVVPSTGGSAASFVAYASPAAANSVITQVGVASGTSYLSGNIVGTATYPSLELRTGSSQTARLTVNNAGNLTVAAPDSGSTLVVNSVSSVDEALLTVGYTSQHQGNFSTAGDARTRTLVLRRTTTNASPAEMYLDGSSLQMVLANDSTWHFDISVVARRTDADNESAGYRFSGVIDRNTNAASTALVGTVTATTDAEDNVGWDAAVTADTGTGALVITVTGEVSKTIRWVAFVRTVEVIG